MISLNDNSLVFCTAEVPVDLLTKFFEEAYSPSSSMKLAPIMRTLARLPPVSDQSSRPFNDKSAEEIWVFARQNIEYPPIYNRAVAIPDDLTAKYKEICVLVTRRSLAKEDQSELIIVRSYFKSALMILNISVTNNRDR
ncbi:hypothetical protein SLS63_008026 [Diaporthe eres]|uniref:Uncharacterized protein n=1 Tax=Diaporthe eres TaxID=83184 RepID=A0ABR1P3L5_DIAER